MDSNETVCFYTSKIKMILMIIMFIALTLGCLWLFLAVLAERIFDLSAVLAATALIFIAIIIIGIKRMKHEKPAFIFTKKALVLDASSKYPVHLKWEDISGYEQWTYRMNKFIAVYLHNEQEYRDAMSSALWRRYKINDMMKIPLFNIAITQVKSNERAFFLEELEKRTFGDTTK